MEIDHRIIIWDEIKRKNKDDLYLQKDIEIVLWNGDIVKEISGHVTPLLLARRVSKSLAKRAVVAVVDGVMWDVDRVLVESCHVEIVGFDDPRGKKVFWHSSAHVMGQALERIYQGRLCTGPPIESGGFYYDMSMDSTISCEDFKEIERIIEEIVSEDQPFERLVLSKKEALEMFKFNPYKIEIIKDKVLDGESCTAYRVGSLIDLCKGPHVPSSGIMKGFKVTKNSSAYWKGNAENENLQRVYGISFPSVKELKIWIKLQKEREERDHRALGKKQELFFFHPLSPGSAFFLPKGMVVYNKLIDFLKYHYNKRDYLEVLTPNIFNKKLWEKSGHWQHYKEDMFCLDCDKTEFALKPMNCPGHCLMFQSSARSYKDLPLRFAEFGVLHRNELSGALSGLTRVRRFEQDDAHIFVREDQIQEELQKCFSFMKDIYAIFGFKFSLALSTRPQDCLGSPDVWEKAENLIAGVLNDFVGEDGWDFNDGDGAFYGPKIDISIKDVMDREHQCATMQLDFVLPGRFGLEYQNSDGKMSRPVMIHRAIFGSLERFFAILIEHLNGKWPFWLSPRQASIVSVSPEVGEYAREVYDLLKSSGYQVDLDISDKKLAKKVRESQMNQFNYILVIGKSEMQNRSVNIRTRENEVKGESSLDELLSQFSLESKLHLQ